MAGSSGMGRNLGALKAELGAQARGAFQALAGLKVAGGRRSSASRGRAPARRDTSPTAPRAEAAASAPRCAAGQRYTAWTFGELPELMEVRKARHQSLIGFPALIDGATQ